MVDDFFSLLMAPVDLATFAAEVWEQKPIYIPGTPDKVGRWHLDRAAFFEGLVSRREIADKIKIAFNDPDGVHREEEIDPRLASAMFDAGMTVCVTRFESGDPTLMQLAASARRTLGHAGEVIINAYASPAGKGFGTHFDPQSVFVIQLDGSKKWRFGAAPAMPNPPGNCVADRSGLAEFKRTYPWAQFETPSVPLEQTLQPGDVLYLPAGTWHRAEAEGHSIALTLTILPFSARDLFLEMLEKAFESDPRWRQYVPLMPIDSAPVVGLPSSIEHFIAARSEELRSFIANVTVSKVGVGWRSRLGESTVERSVPDAAVRVTPNEVLRVNQPVSLLDNPQDDSVAFFAGAASMEMPAENAPFLQHIIERKQFVAREAVGFCAPDEELDWDNVRDALQLLVDSGAVAIGASGKKTIHKRPIPSSGELLPVIGLGTWRTFDVGPTADARRPIFEVLARFLEVGGRLIDSSPMYGHAEEVAGEELAKIPNAEPFLATKVWTQGRHAGIEQMEGSMKRIRTGRVDLMQVHNLVDVATHLPVLREWKAAERIRYIGVTHYDHDQFDAIEQLMRNEKLDFIQIPYSIVDRRAEARILPAAADTGTAVLVMQPFGSGGLFKRVKNKPLPRVAAELDCTSWAQFFLKFIIGHPAVTCPIPATANPAHAVDNLHAGFGRIPNERQRAAMIAAL